MTHPKRAIGLSMLVALALISTGVVTAQASAPEFHVAEAPATLTGSKVAGSETVLGTEAGKVKCTEFTATGTQSATSSTKISLAAVYSSCTLGGSAVTVATNGCEEVTTLEAGTSPPSGTLELACPEGKAPEIVAQGGGCVIKWEQPKPGKPMVSEENTTGPPKDIDQKVVVSNWPYTITGCLGVKDGTYTNGVKTNNITIKADNKGGKQENLFAE